MVKWGWKRAFRRLAVYGEAAVISLVIWYLFPKIPGTGDGSWLVCAVICGLISAGVILTANRIAEPEQMKLAIRRIQGIFGRGGRKKEVA